MSGVYRSTAAFAAVFFVVVSLTIWSSRIQGGLALTWLSTGVGAGWLLLIPQRRWPLALASMIALNAIATTLWGFGPRLALPLALINALECVIVAGLMLVLRPCRDWFDNLRGLAAFIAAVGLLASPLAGSLGAYAVTELVGGSWADHFVKWWAGHSLGTVIGLPIVLATAQWIIAGRPTTAVRFQIAEFALLWGLVLVVSLKTIGQAQLPLLFLPILPLMVLSFRCGRLGAVIGMLTISGVVLWASIGERSIVATLDLSDSEKILFLQFYLAVLSMLSIPVSVAQRQHLLLIEELEYRKGLLRLIAEHSDDALINLDANGDIRFASPASERFTGREDVEGEPLSVFFEPIDRDIVLEAMERTRANPGETVVIERPVFTDGEELWLEARLRTASLRDGSPGLEGFAVTIREVTQRKNMELDAIHASETDPLTLLPNRRVLLRQLERSIVHADRRPVSLAIIDLDHFKAINDTHGHIIGDLVLRNVAEVLRSYVTPSRMVARLGGEEFALVDHQPDFEVSRAIAEDLREAIAAVLSRGADGKRFRVTASIGMCQLASGQSISDALAAADRLLYRAKDRGRNRVVVTDTPQTKRGLRAA